MSNEFDIEKARAGEPVEYLTDVGEQWIPVHFVGVDMDGNPVAQRSRSGGTFSLPAHRTRLRMAAKKITVRYRVAALRKGDGGIYTASANNQSHADEVQSWDSFIDWLTDWQEAEIPSESA